MSWRCATTMVDRANGYGGTGFFLRRSRPTAAGKARSSPARRPALVADVSLDEFSEDEIGHHALHLVDVHLHATPFQRAIEGKAPGSTWLDFRGDKQYLLKQRSRGGNGFSSTRNMPCMMNVT